MTRDQIAADRMSVLLEDLSSLPTFGWSPRTTLVEAEPVIHDIASLHAAWWTNAQLRELSRLELRGATAVDQVGRVFESSSEPFLAKLSVPLSEEIMDVRPLGVRYLPRVWAYLFGADPITLLHHDVQGANILFDRRRISATFIDWQLATVGRGAVDVAYFLCRVPRCARSPECLGTAWYGYITLCFSKAASSVTRWNIAESTVVSPAASGRSTSRGGWNSSEFAA